MRITQPRALALEDDGEKGSHRTSASAVLAARRLVGDEGLLVGPFRGRLRWATATRQLLGGLLGCLPRNSYEFTINSYASPLGLVVDSWWFPGS